MCGAGSQGITRKCNVADINQEITVLGLCKLYEGMDNLIFSRGSSQGTSYLYKSGNFTQGNLRELK